MSGLISMPRKQNITKQCGNSAIPTWTAFRRLSEQSGFKAPETRLSHLCQTAKGVWLEMRLFWDTSWTCNCSNFAHHPSQF